MKNIWIILLLGLALLIGVILIADGYDLIQAIEKPLYKAQGAENYEEMGFNLVVLKENMNRHGMVDGHFGIISKNSANDLSIYHKSIDQVLSQLNEIRGISEEDDAYQLGLFKCREIISNLSNPVLFWFLAHNWPLCLLEGVMIGWIILFLLSKITN